MDVFTQPVRYAGGLIGATVSAIVAVAANSHDVVLVTWVAGWGIPIAGIIGFALAPIVIASDSVWKPAFLSAVAAVLVAMIGVLVYTATQPEPLGLGQFLFGIVSLGIFAFLFGFPVAFPVAIVSAAVLRRLARLDRSILGAIPSDSNDLDSMTAGSRKRQTLEGSGA